MYFPGKSNVAEINSCEYGGLCRAYKLISCLRFRASMISSIQEHSQLHAPINGLSSSEMMETVLLIGIYLAVLEINREFYKKAKELI